MWFQGIILKFYSTTSIFSTVSFGVTQTPFRLEDIMYILLVHHSLLLNDLCLHQKKTHSLLVLYRHRVTYMSLYTAICYLIIFLLQ